MLRTLFLLISLNASLLGAFGANPRRLLRAVAGRRGVNHIGPWPAAAA